MMIKMKGSTVPVKQRCSKKKKNLERILCQESGVYSIVCVLTQILFVLELFSRFHTQVYTIVQKLLLGEDCRVVSVAVLMS